MFNVGMSELFVFGIIALLVLGPEKLPEAARFAGKWYAKLMHFVNNAKQDIDRELGLFELREQVQQEMQRMAELEQKMQSQLAELRQQTEASDAKQQLQSSAIEKTAKFNSLIYCDLLSNQAYYAVFTPHYLQKFLQHQPLSNDYQTEPKASSLVKLKVIA
ncbi:MULTISPECIES: Sec-independent protein translocase protein TatB [Acinetobacter]|uniref:Sec-independent protein translocase protein TatB n=1 Tax=Acinetobacter TaxID=469 RepID=UPI000CFF6F13|nr:Sec-independent protein translocase protein TatB [Acinetobacter sp. MYb10]QLD60852.1 twin-arginine translocase subunit TatB [Acinetobacter sp. MYb10]